METKAIIKKKMFKSSVQLMLVSKEVSSLAGVTIAAALMCTVANKNLLVDIGVSTQLLEGVNEQDLIVVVKGRDDRIVKKALQHAETLLSNQLTEETSSASNLEEAINNLPTANMALISLPGEIAVREAKKALEYGLHVHLFSDNISISDEVELKKNALSKGLLMMGPDCGSAIINGVPLGFANAIRRGSIGIVSASGTGLQEVSCIIDRLGFGVSQAIGVGGRDLTSGVGGLMLMDGMRALDKDQQTKVVVVISKPPSIDVMEKINNYARGMTKPIVMNIIGEKGDDTLVVRMVSTLEEAARKAVNLISENENSIENGSELVTENLEKIVKQENSKKHREQRFLRGLFVGGTLCSEALSLLNNSWSRTIHTNIIFTGTNLLDDIFTSVEDACIDMGADQFTKGMAHPMIDPTVRQLRLIKEGKDPKVSVILMDIVLGYGAHADPAGVIIPVIKDVQSQARKEGRHISFVVSVIGTDQDPQNRRYSIARLRDIGVIIAESNAQAVTIARAIINDQKI